LKNYIKSLFTPTALQQLVKVGLIGVVNTIVSFTLFNVFLSVLGGVKTVDEGFNWEQFWSVALSFIIATFVSYLLNRRWAFALRDSGDAARETAHFFAINLVAWAITQAFVSGADVLWGPLSRLGGNVAYISAALVIIIPKFAGYRDIVFRKAIDEQARQDELSTT
jgi:putative flippase GtrA